MQVMQSKCKFPIVTNFKILHKKCIACTNPVKSRVSSIFIKFNVQMKCKKIKRFLVTCFVESRCYMDYFNIYKDVWNFHKKYKEVQTTDEYWDNVINESNELGRKYNSRFASALIIAVLEELEQICREMEQNAVSGV